MSRSIITKAGQEVTRYTSDRSFDFEYAPGKILAFPHDVAIDLANTILKLEKGDD